MSIKIYNGFRLSMTSFSIISSEIEKLRSEVNKIAKKNTLEYLVGILLKNEYKKIIKASNKYFLDDDVDENGINLFSLKSYGALSKGLPLLKEYSLYGLFCYISESINYVKKEGTSLRVFLGDPSLTIYLYPLRNKVLGFYASEKVNYYLEEIKNIKTYEEYGYQNSSDSIPDGVTLRQWNKRLKDWQEALLSRKNIDGFDDGFFRIELVSMDIFMSIYSDFIAHRNINLIDDHVCIAEMNYDILRSLTFDIMVNLAVENKFSNKNEVKPSDFFNEYVKIVGGLKSKNKSIVDDFEKINSELEGMIGDKSISNHIKSFLNIKDVV